MSNEPKKYPADTPVTLEMLSDMLRKAAVKYKSPFAGWFCDTVEEHIEPPKPEPKPGELWLCSLYNIGDKVALWKKPSMWCVYHSGKCHGFGHGEVLPIKRLIPAEDINE